MTCLTIHTRHRPNSSPPPSTTSTTTSQTSISTPVSPSPPLSTATTASTQTPSSHSKEMPPTFPTGTTTTVSQILRINLNIRQYRSPAYRFTNYKASWAPTVKRETRDFSSKSMDQAKFSQGMNVEYKPVGGRNSNTSSSTGRIERVLTEDTLAGSTGVNVKASEENPRYEIKNNRTGKTSAVKEENILHEASTD